MSKIKFDEKDFGVSGDVWEKILKWSVCKTGEDAAAAMEVNRAVQRLIKKYVKRERKRMEKERTRPMNWPSDFPGKH